MLVICLSSFVSDSELIRILKSFNQNYSGFDAANLIVTILQSLRIVTLPMNKQSFAFCGRRRKGILM